MGLENLNPGEKNMARPANIHRAVLANDKSFLSAAGKKGAKKRFENAVGTELEADRIQERRDDAERFRLEQAGELVDNVPNPPES
jgi:hypothetical protein